MISAFAEYERLAALGPYPCKGFGKVCGAEVEIPTLLCKECREAEHHEEQRKQYLEWVEKSRRNMLSTAPEDLQWSSFDAPELASRVTGGAKMVKKAKAAVEALASKKCQRIVLQGPAGVGKSVLAVATFRHLLWNLPLKEVKRDTYSERAVSMFVDAPELGWIRQDSRLGEEPEALADIRDAPLLVLDDIGGEAPIGPTAIAVIGEMIRARHRSGRPTIYTTGFGVDALTRMYGAGVTRRIFDRAILIGWEAAQ